MASPRRSEDGRQASSPGSPDFCKLILPETLLLDKLKIPKKFVKKYGNTLSDSVYLQVPNGKVWQIDLTRNNKGKVWLENGWKTFIEYYSLGTGHMVAFRYKGNSNFCVFIFDMNSSEIDYRPNDICGEERKTPTDPISVETLDDFDPHTPPQNRKRTNSTSGTNNGANVLHPLASPVYPEDSQSNRMKLGEISLRVVIFRETLDANCPLSEAHMSVADKATDDGTKATDDATKATDNGTMDVERVNSENDACVDILDEFSPRKKQEVGAGGVKLARRQRLKSKAFKSMKSLTSTEKAIYLQKAREFKSESPFFMIVMQPSYVHKGNKLNIPADFARRHFDFGNGDVILFTSDGRTWSGKYKFKVENTKRSAELYSGWKAFAKDNGLKVGDVCVFELKRGTKAILRVVIFRETNNANSPLAQAERVELKKSTDPETDAKFKNATSLNKAKGRYERMTHKDRASCGQRPSSSSITGALETNDEKYPSFRIVMSPAYLRRRNVNVPTSFARKIIKNGACNVRLQVGDKFWRIKLICYDNFKRGLFSKGWYDFVKQNAIQEGDACEFELINYNDGIIKVSVSREPEMEAERENASTVDNISSSSPSRSQEVKGTNNFTIQPTPSSSQEVEVEDKCGQRTCKDGAVTTIDEKSPSFRAVMTSSYLEHGSVCVPVAFARKFIKNGDCTVKLKIADRLWPVKLKNYENRKALISKGWVAFVKQNALQVGDACEFELINKEDGIIEVSISRVSS